MKEFRTGMRSTIIVLAILFLTACTSEKPNLPSAVVSTSAVTDVPALTSEATVESTAQATPSPIVTEDCSRGDYFEEMESGGQIRQYILHVPPTYNPEEPIALVLVFHGAGIGAERFITYTRFSTVADREGFLIVYPQGLGERPAWNPGPGSQDVEFTKDLIDHLQSRCHIDLNRIFATGQSNGAGMANRLACELSDRIAAIGTVAGAYQSAGCSPSRPIPVFAIHGTADEIVSYSGIPEWASAWAARNGCDPEPVEVVRNVLISERQWGNCQAGADVILTTIQDRGHEWPGDLINVGQTIWDFFAQHPLDSSPP